MYFWLRTSWFYSKMNEDPTFRRLDLLVIVDSQQEERDSFLFSCWALRAKAALPSSQHCTIFSAAGVLYVHILRTKIFLCARFSFFARLSVAEDFRREKHIHALQKDGDRFSRQIWDLAFELFFLYFNDLPYCAKTCCGSCQSYFALIFIPVGLKTFN